MVEYLNNTFHALADPTRRQIVTMLMDTESRTIKDLAEPFDMSLAAVAKHITVLERARLVKRSKSGRDNHLTLNPEPLREVRDWLQYYERFWTHKLDELEKLIAQNTKRKRKKT